MPLVFNYTTRTVKGENYEGGGGKRKPERGSMFSNAYNMLFGPFVWWGNTQIPITVGMCFMIEAYVMCIDRSSSSFVMLITRIRRYYVGLDYYPCGTKKWTHFDFILTHSRIFPTPLFRFPANRWNVVTCTIRDMPLFHQLIIVLIVSVVSVSS